MLRESGERVASETHALMATLQRLARNATALLGVSSVSVALLDARTGNLVTKVALGASAQSHELEEFRPNERVQGWVGAHLEPVFVNDADRASPFASSLPPGARSLACIPLMDAGQLLGTLTVCSPEPGAFGAQRLSLLEIFADQAVLAISKTLQAEATKAKARELTLLLDASRALSSSLDPVQVCHYIVASIRKVVRCDDAIIYLHEAHTGMLRVVAGLGTRAERVDAAQVAVDDESSLAAWVARNRRARLSSPLDSDFGAVTQALLSGETISLLCVPLISRDVLRGVIMLARPAPFSSDELGIMLNLSTIIAAALENATLYQTAWAEREQQMAIFASASDGIAVVDDDLTVIEANEAFARLVGMPRESVLGQRCCAVLQHQRSGACELCRGICLAAAALERGEVMPHIECELAPRTLAPAANPRLAGGRPSGRHLDFSITPMVGEGSGRILLVGRDVSAAREMDQMKVNFLSMISHELRAPLQTISGYLDVLLSGMGGPLADQQMEFLRRARAGSEHMTALVDDLLLMSRRDAGKFTLMRRDTDLEPIIRETVEELEILADDAGVQLTLETPTSLVPIAADGPRIGQVLRNLVSNAIKFTPQGGEVRVVVRETPEFLVFEVRDTGVGIPHEHLDHIFERFYQVSSNTTRGRFQGQGLGLAIVRIIVEGHGGTISVESAPQRGSTFTVKLPRKSPKEEAAKEAS